MAEYANQMNVQIAEVARLTFNDAKQDGSVTKIIDVVVPVPFLKIVHDTLGKVLDEQEKAMEAAKQNNQTNKTLS